MSQHSYLLVTVHELVLKVWEGQMDSY